MEPDLPLILPNFQIDGRLLDVMPYGTGHINHTYASRFQQGDRITRFIHQQINTKVFKKPELLMQNIFRVTTHLQEKIAGAGGDPRRETLTLVPTLDGKAFHLDENGNFWRTYLFIEDARTYDVVENLEHVYSAARAFARFQEMVSDLPGGRLEETIPAFHDTAKRFQRFLVVLKSDPKNRAAAVRQEIDFVLSREKDTGVLVSLLADGRVPERITHNDTKFNNVMIDDKTGEGVCVIDLDTVMPGLPMYDFGDSVRIGANPVAEDERDLSRVGIDLDMFDRLAHGYLDAARDFLTPVELDHLAFSAKLMTFECGMRFLTDHLEGDVYFRIHRPDHNLDRCRTQFKMVAEMEFCMEKMKKIVEQYMAG